MNLVNHLAERALNHPRRIALIDAEQSMTYEDLYSYVCGGSQELKRQGFVSGNTVLILQNVGIPLYVSLLSAFHAGLTVMFVDPSAGKDMISSSLALHQADGFIAVAKAHWLRVTVPEIRAIKKQFHTTAWAAFSKKWNPDKAGISEPAVSYKDTPALITFTSGSTGLPKAACRSHGFLLSQHRALSEALDYQEGEIDLVTLPVFTLANLASGLTSVIANTDLAYPARADSAAIMAQCKKHRVSRCAASPAFFEKLYKDGLLPDFKSIYTGGAPVFPSMLDDLQTANPEMNVITVFGSTEAEPIADIAWSSVSEEDRKRMFAGEGLLVGKAVKATQLRIIPDQFGSAIPPMDKKSFDSLQLAQNEAGEMIVTGEHVLKGYLNGRGDSENKIQVGGEVWHRTGDAAYLDTEGRAWLLGRCQAAIRLPDQSPIYPFGIECAAMAHPDVSRCALLLHKNQVTLFVDGEHSDGTLSDLQTLLKGHPLEQIKFLPYIPVDKRHNAKIDYPELLVILSK
ncbi:MAG: AMP-binding protein [Verrucomicrobiales bacterium]|nr:AMP-binding protein [Verrucomicrobiales bacterium]